MKTIQSKLAVVLLLTLVGMSPLGAQLVQGKYNNLIINAHWAQPNKEALNKPVFLVLHGSIAHGRMELIQGVQNNLKNHGYASLMITLSLNVSDRKGMFDCKAKHTHRLDDAIGELHYWVSWLKAKGVKNIVLMAHSRGTLQVAMYANLKKEPAIKRLVLVSPDSYTFKHLAQDYKKRSGKPLAPLVSKAAQMVKSGKGNTLMKKVRFLHCNDATVTAESFASYYRKGKGAGMSAQLMRNAKTGKLPVLVVVGSSDKVVKKFIPTLKTLSKKKVIKLEVIEGGSHIMRDLYLEEAVEKIVASIK